MTFADAVKMEKSLKLTENGAIAYDTLGNKCFDLFGLGGALRTRSATAIKEKFEEAYKESPVLAFLLAVYIRDIRAGGLGERNTGRIGLRVIAEKQPKFFADNLKQLILECGRADDLYSYLGAHSDLDKAIWGFVKSTLINDIKNMKQGKPITLLAKWLKSANASSEKTRRLGKETAKQCGFTLRQYRQILSALRKYANVVEVQMSARDWDSIDFEGVPSYAMKNYQSAFKLHAPELFARFLSAVNKGEKKINAGTLFPYDLVSQIMYGDKNVDYSVVEAQWNALPNYIEGQNNVLIMADTSGSMIGRPLATAVGLALYFAERNTGIFEGLFMTFSSLPDYIYVNKSDTLQQRIRTAERAKWGMSTNLDNAFWKVWQTAIKNELPPEEMPKAIVVISDMEIDAYDCCGGRDFYQKWQNKFAAAGYQIPKLIWWNVDARQDTFLTRDKGTLCVSGQSVSIFKTILSSLNKTMEEMVIATLEAFAPDYSWDYWKRG